MTIKNIIVGPIETNCYIVSDETTKDCAVIDPGDDGSLIMDYIEENGLKCRCLFLTHAHFDHIGAVNDLLEETDAVLYMNKKDVGIPIGGNGMVFNPPRDTRYYKEGDVVTVGALDFKVMETPGHTPGGVCLICQDALFSGDTLFKDSCGRTDFAASSTDDMMASLKRIGELPGDYEVYPGHMFTTTLDRERRFNYFLREAMRQ